VETSIGVEAVVGADLADAVFDPELFAVLTVLVVVMRGDVLAAAMVLPSNRRAAWTIGVDHSVGSAALVGGLGSFSAALVGGELGDSVAGFVAVKLGGVLVEFVAVMAEDLSDKFVTCAGGDVFAEIFVAVLGDDWGVPAGGLEGILAKLVVVRSGADRSVLIGKLGDLSAKLVIVVPGDNIGVRVGVPVGELGEMLSALVTVELRGMWAEIMFAELGAFWAELAGIVPGGVLAGLTEVALAAVFAVTIFLPPDRPAVACAISAGRSDGSVGGIGSLTGAAFPVAAPTGWPGVFARGAFGASTEAWISRVERLEGGASVVAGALAGFMACGGAAVALGLAVIEVGLTVAAVGRAVGASGMTVAAGGTAAGTVMPAVGAAGLIATPTVDSSAGESAKSNAGASAFKVSVGGIASGGKTLPDGLGEPSYCCITSLKLVEVSSSDGAWAVAFFEDRSVEERTLANG